MDEINRRLARILKELNRFSDYEEDNAKEQLPLTEKEFGEWQANEPDFTKRIVKPLDRKRKGHAMLAIILLALTVPHFTVQASSPTENLQVKLPTVKATLPYAR